VAWFCSAVDKWINPRQSLAFQYRSNVRPSLCVIAEHPHSNVRIAHIERRRVNAGGTAGHQAKP
jgi:hypothetical protein